MKRMPSVYGTLKGGLSTINYFLMSTLRGSVTAGEYILFIDATLAWDQAPHWGKRRKKSARFFRRYFPFWPRLLPFSTPAEPGPGLMPVMLSPKHHINRCNQQNWTLKNCQVHKVSKATVEILLNLFVHSCFLLYLLCHLYLPLIVFEWLLLCFTRFSGSSPYINFVKFGNTAPLLTEVGGSVALTWLMHYPLNLFTLSSGVGHFFYIDCFGTEMS